VIWSLIAVALVGLSAVAVRHVFPRSVLIFPPVPELAALRLQGADTGTATLGRS